MGTTFSVYYVCLYVILNDTQVAQRKERKVNLDYVMECVRWSVLGQYSPKAAEIYPKELRKTKLPYSSLAELHSSAFEKANPCQSN